MKLMKYIIIIIFIIGLIGSIFIKTFETNFESIFNNIKNNNLTEINSWCDYNIVVHSLGEINGITRTHSKEAFIESYLNGGRVFELDLAFTTDGVLVAIHPEMMNGVIVSSPQFTINEFLNSSYYTDKLLIPLTFDDVIDLMIEHPDIYIITDTKETSFEQVQRQFKYIYEAVLEKNIKIIDRIIPQLYHEDMYEYIEEIYPFKEYIFTMYLTNPMTTEEELLYFLEINPKVNTLTIAHNSSRLTPEFITSLKEINIKIYIHTLNDMERINYFWNVGVWGFYSDYITEKYILNNNLLKYSKE